MYLSFYIDFCSWWWLAWLLPFILGLLLGRLLWGKWARVARELEDDLARAKSKLRIADTENKTLSGSKSRLERELDNCEVRNKELVQKNQLLSTSNADLKASALTALPVVNKEKEEKDKFSIIKSSNLQIIEGIGPVMENILHENGIKDWRTLSSKSHGELKAILDTYGDKYKIIDPKDWPVQASLAKMGNWEGLIGHQKADGSESKIEKLFIKLGLI